ncbi:MAG: urease accessory protein UreD, partial [Caulobacterales bacterium]|nr:urease accessory protein UreD [Caulobacterales bacterium]
MTPREAGLAAEPTSAPRALQRSHGAARLSFKRSGARTRLDALHQQGSAKARLMRLDNGGFAEAVLLNTSGGMTDSDRMDTEVAWGPGGRAIVQSQAAERIYRSRGGPARLTTALTVADGACAVWAPQETILFDGGRFERRTDIAVAGEGEVIACEAIVFGRTAMGERVHDGAVDDAWRVRVDGRLVYADGFRLAGDVEAALARPAIAGGALAVATLIYVGRAAEDMRDRARDALTAMEAAAGCTARLGVAVVRLLAHAPLALRAALEAALGAMLAGL